MGISLDLNNPHFQADLFALEKAEAWAVVKTLGKIRQLSWDQLYRDKGLRWELIQGMTDNHGERLYSLRITQKCRAVVQRKGEILRFLSLHPDHDSAYE